jgi:hypothetical protein
MRNIPVNLSGYKLIVTEAPVMKTRKTDDGRTEEIVTDREGVALFVVSLMSKTQGEKGEEIKVTLATDPTAQGDDFEFGSLVELIGATVSPYSFKNDRGETVSGIAFKAQGLKPVG